MRTADENRPRASLRVTPGSIALTALAVVSCKAFLELLYQYRWYLPPDFDASPFLSGRRYSFTEMYASAFYLHLVGGPVSLILGTWLMLSGLRRRAGPLHRFLGRLQLAVILLAVVPSGVAMAFRAYGGFPSQSGFLTLSLLTGWTGMAAAWTARNRQLTAHRRWATRCYALLWSPLLLRLVAGMMIVTGLESELTYQLNAWFSWLVPLTAADWITRSWNENQAPASHLRCTNPMTARHEQRTCQS